MSPALSLATIRERIASGTTKVAAQRRAGAAPVPVRAQVPFDPQLSAFMRAMGVQEQQIRADARQRSNLAARQVSRQLPAFDIRADREAEAIAGDAESRGVYRSGATVRSLMRSRSDIERERNETLAQLRDTQTGIQLDAASQVAALRRARAEAELDARTRQTERAAQSSYGQRGSFF